jgi:alkanesulfonate monooxygenase SsuD/methylene tetrahydromethanopterin reductase-like flavin-dependent oxidoreductase (luciferase family)
MRPANQPDREARKDLFSELESAEVQRRRVNPGGLEHSAGRGAGAGFGVIAGSPDTIKEYMEEYVSTGANYFVASFQWGSLTHEQSMRSLELFATEIMPHHMETPVTGSAV